MEIVACVVFGVAVVALWLWSNYVRYVLPQIKANRAAHKEIEAVNAAFERICGEK